MNPTTENIRRGAQIGLLIATIVFLGAAGWRFASTRDVSDEPAGPHVVATPDAGPVGMRPFLEVRNLGDEHVRVLFCHVDSVPTECLELASGPASTRMRSEPIPDNLTVNGAPSEVQPGGYELRVAHAGAGSPEALGQFQVVPLAVGTVPRPRPLAGADPSALSLGEAVEVARGAPCESSFLPDGRVLLGRTLFDPTTAVTIDLRMRGAELAWSPDRDKLAILTDDRKEIRMAQPDGSAQEVVVREARGFVSSITWAPEGDRIAFVARPEPGVRGGPVAPTVYTLNLVTGERVEVSRGEAVAWSPAGDELAIEMREPGGPAIQIVELTTGASRRLIDGRAPSWSADGTMLAFIRPAAQAGTGWVTPRDAAAPAQLVTEPACSLRFSPDGRRMAVVLDTGDGTRLVLRPLNVAT